MDGNPPPWFFDFEFEFRNSAYDSLSIRISESRSRHVKINAKHTNSVRDKVVHQSINWVIHQPTRSCVVSRNYYQSTRYRRNPRLWFRVQERRILWHSLPSRSRVVSRSLFQNSTGMFSFQLHIKPSSSGGQAIRYQALNQLVHIHSLSTRNRFVSRNSAPSQHSRSRYRCWMPTSMLMMMLSEEQEYCWDPDFWFPAQEHSYVHTPIANSCLILSIYLYPYHAKNKRNGHKRL